jgi:hypothetical protein
MSTIYTLRLVDSDGNTVAEFDFETDRVKEGYYGDASSNAGSLLDVAFARTEYGVETARGLVAKRGLKEGTA